MQATGIASTNNQTTWVPSAINSSMHSRSRILPDEGFHTQLFALFDHSSCTVYLPSFLVFQAQMSPISPLASSYQPCPGTGSVVASHSSWEVVVVSASNTLMPPVQPWQFG